MGYILAESLAPEASRKQAALREAGCMWMDGHHQTKATLKLPLSPPPHFNLYSLYTRQSWAVLLMAPMVPALRSQSSDSVCLDLKSLEGEATEG